MGNAFIISLEITKRRDFAFLKHLKRKMVAIHYKAEPQFATLKNAVKQVLTLHIIVLNARKTEFVIQLKCIYLKELICAPAKGIVLENFLCTSELDCNIKESSSLGYCFKPRLPDDFMFMKIYVRDKEPLAYLGQASDIWYSGSELA